VRAILSVHGDRGRRAIEAVSETRVKQYRDFTVVVGYDEEYVVEDGGCTCKDSQYNLDAADPDQLCWHALAAEIADGVGAVDDHDMWYSDVREFMPNRIRKTATERRCRRLLEQLVELFEQFGLRDRFGHVAVRAGFGCLAHLFFL